MATRSTTISDSAGYLRLITDGRREKLRNRGSGRVKVREVLRVRYGVWDETVRRHLWCLCK